MTFIGSYMYENVPYFYCINWVLAFKILFLSSNWVKIFPRYQNTINLIIIYWAQICTLLWIGNNFDGDLYLNDILFLFKNPGFKPQWGGVKFFALFLFFFTFFILSIKNWILKHKLPFCIPTGYIEIKWIFFNISIFINI